MTSNPIHLTEDQLDEVLIGCASPETAAHLHDCEFCNGQLAEFRSTMAAFHHAASAWSEAKSNALTRDLNRHQPAFRITARAAWSCASVVVLAAATALGLGLHQHADRIAVARQHRQQLDAASSQDLASDDAMLRQIDSALDTSEPSPDELYGIADTASAPRRNSRPQVKD